MIQNNSIKFVLDRLEANLWGLNLEDWAVSSVGTGNSVDCWYWVVSLENYKTREEKKIVIPCYKN